MTVPVQTTYTAAVGNGVTTTFPFQFLLFRADDLQVTVNGAAPAMSYTVQGLGVASGGSVVFAAPPPAGAAILMRRVIALQRSVDYQYNGDLKSSTLNSDFDRIWMALQGLRDEQASALKVPYLERPAPMVDAAARAQKLLGFDALGNPVPVLPNDQSAAGLALQLLGPEGASQIGLPGGGTLAELAKGAHPVSDYTAARNYEGPQASLYVTGVLGSPFPDRRAGIFDPIAGTAPDDGGVIIVDALDRRYRRRFDGYIRPEWFSEPAAAVSRTAIVSALAAGSIVLSAGLTYLVDTGPVPVPSGALICGEEGSILRCTMSGLGPEVGIFTNTGGKKIRLRGITVANVPILNADYDRFLFKGLSVSDVRVERSDCTNAAVAMFGTTAQSSPFALDATTYAAVVTDESNPGFNQSRDVHVSDYKVRGLAADRTLVRASAYFHYCKRWSATDGDVQDAAFPVMFWGGDSAQPQGAVGSERKCSRGKIVNVNSLRTVAGPWGSNGDDITATSCDGQDGFDVGLDFEGCTNSHSVNCTMSGFANGNFTNFFYGKNVTHTGWGSKQGSASAPHIRIYNNSNDGSNNRQIGFYDGTAETVGIIGVLDDSAGPASELSFCRNKLINTRIDLSAPNKENLRVEDNDLLFTLSAGGQMMAISVTGCSGSNAKVRRNTVRSLVSQPSSSAAIYAVNTDANFAPVFDIHRNTTEGFPADLFMGCTSVNAGIPGVFVVEDNQFGAGVIGYVNPTRVLSKWRRNRDGAFQNFPNGPDTTRFWSVGTEAETDAPAIGQPARWRVITSGFPATWAKEAALTAA